MSLDDLDDLDGLEAELQRDAATRQQRLAATQQAAHSASAKDGSVRPCYPGVQEWVAAVFSPTFARRSTPTFTWCAQWWRHPEALVRLEALWRSWETLRLDPLLGMSSWLSGHLDAQLPILTGPAGPFAGCDPTRHFEPDPVRLAHQPAPAHWWPTPSTS